ncbi:MAG: hypothetical protein VB125_03995 [Burkholderia sp.]
MPEIEDMGITSPLRSIYATTPQNRLMFVSIIMKSLPWGYAIWAQRASVALRS